MTACVATGPRQVAEVAVRIPAGACIADVLRMPAVRALLPASPDSGSPDAGIWGRRRPLSHGVRDGDRVEVYRSLRVDPMTARRERFKQQGARATGLFAAPVRDGGKAGY